VLTAADIRAYGWRTLAEALRSVRGLYLSYDRNYSYLGARGFLRPGDYNTRFLLQIDGNRINDAVFDQAPMGGEFPLDLELVERIEFVPGPGSSVYGSNAFFGVVNVITRRPQDLEGSTATLSTGQDGARRAALSQGWRDDLGTEWLLAASRYQDRRPRPVLSRVRWRRQRWRCARPRWRERHRLFAKASHGDFTATLIHAQRDKGVPTASFSQRFNDPRSRTVDTQNYADLVYRAALSQQTEINARLYWGNVQSLGDYATDDDNRTLNRDLSVSRWWGAELTVLATVAGGHKLLAGLDFEDDYRQRMLNFDLAPATTATCPRTTTPTATACTCRTRSR
jgi:outer membrane receptor protein involved in Fe transport